MSRYKVGTLLAAYEAFSIFEPKPVILGVVVRIRKGREGHNYFIDWTDNKTTMANEETVAQLIDVLNGEVNK